MRSFLIGAATLALAAGVAHADPGKGQGGGKGGEKGGGQAAGPVNPGGGGGGKDKGGDRGPSMQAAKADRGPAMRADKGDKAEVVQAERRSDMRKMRGKDRSDAMRDVRTGRRGDRDVRVIDRDGSNVRVVRFDRDGNRGVINGCPPGLAKKNNGCMPPGLAKKNGNWRNASYRPSWFGYTSLDGGRYSYNDGYLYRMGDNGSILGFVPLLGGALSVGNQWPDYYQRTSVPDYYVDYYNLGAQNSYRYADDVLYRVDPQTSAITAIAALLTGDQFNVGQQMPMGYDVYNVPYEYRDRYAEGADANYRYSDGYVYQVDPKTQLIAAAIQLLT